MTITIVVLVERGYLTRVLRRRALWPSGWRYRDDRPPGDEP
jgi:hypothetical protein